MADSLLEKATSALDEARETATSAIGEAKETVTASAETVKPDVLKDAVDNVVTRGIDGAKSLLHNLEEKKDEVSSKIIGAVSHFTGDLPVSSDNQVRIKENFRFLYLEEKLDVGDKFLCFFFSQLQPLLAAGETTTPWWNDCCGVLDLLKESSSSTR